MNLPSKYLMDLLETAGNLLSDSSGENWQAFMDAFSDAEMLEQRIGENIPLLLQKQMAASNYRDDDNWSPDDSEWVFTSTTGNIKVVIEIERQLGKYIVTGQIFPGSDQLAIWVGAQLEMTRDMKVIALAEINADGEFETVVEGRGAIDCTIIATDGHVLEINAIPIP